MTEKNNPHCGFCGKGSGDVLALIAGPDRFICNECVDLCKEIANEANIKETNIIGLSLRERQAIINDKKHFELAIKSMAEKERLNTELHNKYVRHVAQCDIQGWINTAALVLAMLAVIGLCAKMYGLMS